LRAIKKAEILYGNKSDCIFKPEEDWIMTIGELIKELAKYDFDMRINTSCENCGDRTREVKIKQDKSASSFVELSVGESPYLRDMIDRLYKMVTCSNECTDNPLTEMIELEQELANYTSYTQNDVDKWLEEL